MRTTQTLCALLVVLPLGCARTVYRLDQEVRTPAGPARTPCEKEGWLVVARTRCEQAQPDRDTTVPRTDGLALYRVGGSSPVSIPKLADDLGPSPMLPPHETGVADYDRDRVVSAALGAAGLIAIGVGTGVFINSFETRRAAADDSRDELEIHGGRATLGGVLVLVGFGLGVGGLVLNPNHRERANAEAARYVFLPPDDKSREVIELVAGHNGKVRQACERLEHGAAPADEPSESDRPEEEPEEDEPEEEPEEESEEEPDSDDESGESDDPFSGAFDEP